MSESPATTPTASDDRLAALDAIRAWAMLLGVAFHAAAAYMHAPMRGLIMPVQEAPTTRVVDAAFWTLHVFRVPLFFVVAGMVAAMALSRKGPRSFLRERWTRLGLVLLVAYPMLTIAMQPIWLWGWVGRGWASWGHLFALKYGPELQRAVWGWNHLWFLLYLLLYACGLAGAVWLADVLRKRSGANRASTDLDRHEARARWPALVLAIPAAIFATWGDISWFLDFHNSYLPQPRPFLFYGAFFAVGVALVHLHWQRLTRRWWAWLLVAAPLAGWFIDSLMDHVATTPHGPRQGTNFVGAAPALALVGAALAGSLGFLGLARSLVPRLGTFGRFLADAAYWVYLTHLAWVGLFVMLLHRSDLPPEAKWAIVTLLSSVAALATFVPVRSTKLGRLLGARLGRG